MSASTVSHHSSFVNQIATLPTAVIVGEPTEATARIAAILERHSVAVTLLPEKRLLYMLAQPSDRGSAQLYVFNLLTPFRYDWRDGVGRLRAAQPDAAIVVAIERPTREAIDDAMRASADELLYEPELSSSQLIWQRIGGFLEVPISPIAHPPSSVPQLRIATPDLRAPSGRLDATKVAQRLGVPIARLAAVVGVSRQALSQTPDSSGIQHALDPIARTLHVLDDSLDPDDQRKWLRTSRENLDGRTPLDRIMSGSADAVARMLESVKEIE